MADEKEKLLKVKLEYVTDKASTSTVKGALADIQKALDDTTKRAAKLKAELDDMNNRGPKVKATLASLTKNLDNDLARSAEKANVFSNRLEKVDRTAMALEATGRAFGGTWGGILADMSGRVGDLAMALEQVQRLGGLKGVGGLGKGLGALGGLSVGGVAAAGVLGVGAGALGYEGLRSAGIAKGASLGQFASVGAYGAGSIFGDDTAKNWFKTVAQWTGEIAQDAPKAEKSLKGLGESAKVLPSYVQKTIDDIASLGARAGQMVSMPTGVSLPTGGMVIGSKSVARRNAAIKAGMEAARVEEDTEAQRTKIIKAAKVEQINAELEFQRERKQSITQFNLEAKQAQQQHNTDMKRMRQDSERQLTSLSRQRDAIGYLQAWEENKINTERAEQDFQLQQKQSKDKFSLTLAQEQQDFEAQQAARKRNVAAQLDDLQTSLSKENKVRQQGYDTALKQAKNFANQLGGAFNGLSGDNINRQIAKAFS